jgi:hypothetical protein
VLGAHDLADGLVGLQAATLVLLAGVPWLATRRLEALIAVLCLYRMAGSALAPIWSAWIGDIVPERVRATFFARRSRTSIIAALVESVHWTPVPWTLVQGWPVRVAIRGTRWTPDRSRWTPVTGPERTAGQRSGQARRRAMLERIREAVFRPGFLQHIPLEKLPEGPSD